MSPVSCTSVGPFRPHACGQNCVSFVQEYLLKDFVSLIQAEHAKREEIEAEIVQLQAMEDDHVVRVEELQAELRDAIARLEEATL